MYDFNHEYAKEFYYKGGNIGVLVIHGFTGTPSEVRYLGEYLKGKGFTVKGVLIKGHGTSPEDMQKTNYRDWISSAVEAYKSLKQECDEVFAVGLSMGGALALYLARNFDIKGAAVLAAPIRIRTGSYIIKYLKSRSSKNTKFRAAEDQDPIVISYDKMPIKCILNLMRLMGYVKVNLKRIHKPVLIMQSYNDMSVHPVSANIIYQNIGSKDKSIVYLHESGHIMTCGCEKERVFEEVYQFIKNKSDFKEKTNFTKENDLAEV